jgi:hypothetical protein
MSMRLNLRTILLSTVALAAVLAGPATASGATLTATNASLGMPAETAEFHDGWLNISGPSNVKNCDVFDLGEASITQNGADPITLDPSSITISGCETSSGLGYTYTNVQATGPMELHPDGTGTLPISASETQTLTGLGCVREGTLDITFNTNSLGGGLMLSGDMDGSQCGGASHWIARASGPTEYGYDLIDWVVTP